LIERRVDNLHGFRDAQFVEALGTPPAEQHSWYR
jgi:hypothetical protein